MTRAGGSERITWDGGPYGIEVCIPAETGCGNKWILAAIGEPHSRILERLSDRAPGNELTAAELAAVHHPLCHASSCARTEVCSTPIGVECESTYMIGT